MPSESELAAALAVIKATGYTVAEATAAHDQTTAALRTARDTRHVCHRCQAPATAQWQRHATADEAEAWHAGREQWIRQHNDGHAEAEYVSDRADTVTLAVHGCDDHDLSPGPADETNAAKYEARQVGAGLRTLTHDADCGGHGACGCGGGDGSEA
jgi:hypothetical protein